MTYAPFFAFNPSQKKKLAKKRPWIAFVIFNLQLGFIIQRKPVELLQPCPQMICCCVYTVGLPWYLVLGYTGRVPGWTPDSWLHFLWEESDAHLTFQIHHQAAAVWRFLTTEVGTLRRQAPTNTPKTYPRPSLVYGLDILTKRLVVWDTWDMLTRRVWGGIFSERFVEHSPTSRVVNESIILPSFSGWCIENPPTGQEPRKTLSLYLMHWEETSFRKHKIDTNSQRNVARVIEFLLGLPTASCQKIGLFCGWALRVYF